MRLFCGLICPLSLWSLACTAVTSASPALDDYIYAWTRGSAPSSAVAACVAETVPLDSGIALDIHGRPQSQPFETYILRTLLATHPEVAALSACLVARDLVPAAVYAQSGGALLFAAATPRVLLDSASPDPTELFAGLVAHGVARNHTLGARGRGGLPDSDAFTVAHKALCLDKRTVDDVAGLLLQPLLSRGYAAHLQAVSAVVGEGSPAVAAAGSGILSARLVHAHGHGHGRRRGRGRELGRCVAAAPVAALLRSASLRVLRALASAPQVLGQPTLGTLAAVRDRFGRTPLHMAALQDNADAVALLANALAQELPPEDVARALCARDAAGYAATDLAVALGHNAASLALADAVAAAGVHALPGVCSDAPPPASSLLPAVLARAYPSAPVALAESDAAGEAGAAARRAATALPASYSDNGGWSDPTLVSASARDAVAAAAAGAAAGGCDVDVVHAAALTAERFVREHFLPARPVLVKGLATPWARAWRRNELVAAHGGVAVKPAGIPYAATFGDPESPPLTLRDFVAGLAAGGDRSSGRIDRVVQADGAANAMPAASPPLAPYVFNRLHAESSPAVRALLANMTLVPPFLANARLPTWPPSEGHRVPLVLEEGLSATLFVGGPGTGAPMHWHGDAWNAVMWGRKVWSLLPPARAEYSTVSAADYTTLVLPRLAAAGKAPLLCTQAAGDVLFVPRNWGHAVINVNTSVGYVVEFETVLRRYG